MAINENSEFANSFFYAGQNGHIVIAGHKYGDLDSAGAVIAATRLALANGFTVTPIAFGDFKTGVDRHPNGIWERLGLKINNEAAAVLSALGQQDTLVILDVAIPDRVCDDPGLIVNTQARRLVLDHHEADNPNNLVRKEKDYFHIDPEAHATSQLWLEWHGVHAVVDQEVAIALFMGIMDDTAQGRAFKFGTTEDRAQRVTMALARLIDKFKINQEQLLVHYYKIDPELLPLIARLISNTVNIETDAGIVSISSFQGINIQQPTLLAGAYEYWANNLALGSGTAAAMAWYIRESGENFQLKLSIRSAKPIALSLAQLFQNGGGHKNGAGATITLPKTANPTRRLKSIIETTIEKVRSLKL